MLFLSLFLAGFTLGVFTALFIFAPEKQEEVWDPQNFPIPSISEKLKPVHGNLTHSNIAVLSKMQNANIKKQNYNLKPKKLLNHSSF